MFDSASNIVYKQYERDTDKITTDKNENIDKYLKELKKITHENNKVICNVESKIIGLIHEIEDMLASLRKKLCKALSIDKYEIKSLENIFMKHVNEIIKRIKEIASNLSFE